MNVATSTLSLVTPTSFRHPAGIPDTIDELRFALRQCQRRLGTTAETPHDFDHARDLAHAINNHLQREYLIAAVRGAE